MNNHAKFMARGKSDTTVEGQEVRKDENAMEWDGRGMKRNGWWIMWVDKTDEEEEWVKEEEQEEGWNRFNAKCKRRVKSGEGSLLRWE